jgi:hypothetical protein
VPFFLKFSENIFGGLLTNNIKEDKITVNFCKRGFDDENT